jgi:hypothetical protein
MRRPMRVDAEDGPWTVSVAQDPHEPSSYILNVQSTCQITIELAEAFIFVNSFLLHELYLVYFYIFFIFEIHRGPHD